MKDKEWRKTLAGLDEDFQLTPYKQKLYNNKNGSIWYVAEQNALCLIPSNVRQDDRLNQLGLHNYELSHACDNDNEIIRGFAAIYARLFSHNPDLLQVIERDEEKRMELITIITERLSDMEYDNRESINYWQETLERENERSLWKLLNIDFYNLKQLYGLYMRLNLHQIERPQFDPTNYMNAFHKLVWLTDGEDFIERINDIKIQQVLEYDYTTFHYGLHNEQCKINSACASYFVQELLNYCCHWTIYRICLKNSDAWNDLSTLQRTDLILAIVHHSVRYDNKELALSFADLTAGELYKTYLSSAYQTWKERLEKNPATAFYADDDNYIWHELYKEEKEAFESNKLMEILPVYLYEHLQDFAQGLLRFINHHHFGDKLDCESALKTDEPECVPVSQEQASTEIKEDYDTVHAFIEAYKIVQDKKYSKDRQYLIRNKFDHVAVEHLAADIGIIQSTSDQKGYQDLLKMIEEDGTTIRERPTNLSNYITYIDGNYTHSEGWISGHVACTPIMINRYKELASQLITEYRRLCLEHHIEL